MISSNKRGIRRAATRVRLAVAAAVLVGGGAAGVVAVAASHSGATTAQAAGYTRQALSEPKALSSAMNGWSKSPGRSLTTLSEMTPMRTFNTTAWHHVILVVQRGTVVATARREFVVKSSNHALALWHLSRNTKYLNVGGSRAGMAAMTGGTMAVRGRMNANAKGLANGDLVFVFGERENHTLIAQLVLFAAPVKVTPKPTATPSMTATPGMTATPTATAPTFGSTNS